nr:MAG TPA_asm: hypothetical protein [Caudoviricetes sp.]
MAEIILTLRLCFPHCQKECHEFSDSAKPLSRCQ